MIKKWWKEAVVYQIYTRSFYDSNGDGIGDIRGIIEKLDYIKDFGVDVIWLNPVYKSPNDDNGYDISDYQDIMDEFGTLKDWEELLSKMHERGIKLIMDLVVNHTSDEHAWFVESRSSKDNPKRDYYIWKEGRGGKEPNNWESYFSNSTWEYDENTGEYFLHLFSKKQPDLNWKNPIVREEVFSMMKWWIDKGIDGFRMDVINLLSKPEGLPNSQKEPTNRKGYVFDASLYANQPGIHKILREMNEKVLKGKSLMTVGETPHVTPEVAVQYVNEDREELDMVFHFEVVSMSEWDLVKFKAIQKKWYEALKDKAWNSQYLNNHDQPRQVSRFGNDKEYRVESAKLLGTVLHTLPGTPYIYQGEEIGMTNVEFPSIAFYNDIMTVNLYNKYVEEGMNPEDALRKLQPLSRDNARTPMQWNDKENGGFTSGKPWININPNYKNINVEKALEDKDSIFYYYKKLISMRKTNPVMAYGNYQPLLEDHKRIMAYIREFEGVRWLIAANFSIENAEVQLDRSVNFKKGLLILSNYSSVVESTSTNLCLRPYEVRIYAI